MSDVKNLTINGTTYSIKDAVAREAAVESKEAVEQLSGVPASVAAEGGAPRLHALKSYEDKGEMLSDKEGLADVKNYAHSTFDLSKFAVVGSLNITDDGIARGFVPHTSWITLPLTPKDFKGHSWRIKAKWVNENADQSGDSNAWVQPLLSIHSDYPATGSIAIGRGAPGTAAENTLYVRFLGATHTGSEANNEGVHIETAISPLPDYCIVSASFDYQTGEYKLWADTGNGDEYIGSWTPTTTQKELRIIYNESTNNIHQGCCSGTYVHDALDLKYTHIEMDGVPVFSGNITGIDTIKPDDYTVVGTPTISADGIMSNCSTSNYITCSPTLPSSYSTFEIDLGEYIFTNVTTNQWLVTNRQSIGSDTFGILFMLNTSGKIRYFLSTGSGSGDIASGVIGNITYTVNTKIKFKLVFNGTRYTFYSSVNGGSWQVDSYVDSSSKIALNSLPIWIGSDASFYLLGSVDINTFKIYVDGNLVYQPCLKVPYTESKTGSKVVDSFYAPRLSDMYDQFGYAPYYMLQEESKPNYTVVGSPTISADGVASGFSQGEYIQCNNNPADIANATNWEIEVSFTADANDLSGLHNIIDYHSDQWKAPCLGIDNGYLRWNFSFNNTGWDVIETLLQITVNTKYNIKYGFTGSQYYIKYNNTTWDNEFITLSTYSSTNKVYCAMPFILGNYATVLDRPLSGSIDLNAFKIYVDGDLAYQAVVPPSFSLPQGEIYGLQANKDLSNLSDKGNDKLHALKGYEDKGELLRDEEGMKDVKSYARSTFDLSKFTVVGSPNITDDGIASEITQGNLIYAGSLKSSDFKGHSWEVISPVLNLVTPPSGYVIYQMCGFSPLGYGGDGFVQLLINSTGTLLVQWTVNTPSNDSTERNEGNRAALNPDYLSYKDGDNIQAKVTFDITTGTYSFYYNRLDNNGWIFVSKYVPTTTEKQLYDIVYGNQNIFVAGVWNTMDGTKQKIDLKTMSISVDGVPVFSGNKTGLDTIKPDDYTVVGSPTISADGVLNQATGSSCVTTNTLTLSNNNDIDIEMKVYLLGDHCYVFGGNNGTRFEPYNIPANGNPAWSVLSFAEQFAMAIIEVLPENQWITIRLHYRGANSYAEILENGSFRSLSTFIIANNSFSINEILLIGQFDGHSSNCNIDLNAFKIYVDGDLVYQPCLKIPYTESKTGSKIVSSPYRDRVSDMYNQFGYAPYYTLSDTDFTLPQGELYGMYEKYRKQTLDDMLPDYANRIQVLSTPFTCPSNGYILIPTIVLSNSTWNATINGYGIFNGHAPNHDLRWGGGIYPVSSGDIFTQDSTAGEIYFVPMKGAN